MQSRCLLVCATGASMRLGTGVGRYSAGQHHHRYAALLLGHLTVALRAHSSGAGGSAAGPPQQAVASDGISAPLHAQALSAPGDLLSIVDMPLPPRPPHYVPPGERDPADESLAFLSPGGPLKHMDHEGSAELLEGTMRAPSLAPREKILPSYMDADAARVGSTSVHAGQALLRRGNVVDTSTYYYSAPAGMSASASSGADKIGVGVSPHRSRLHTLPSGQLRDGGEAPPTGATVPLGGTYIGGSSSSGKRSTSSASTPKERSVFAAAHEFTAMETPVDKDEEALRQATPTPLARQLEVDMKKLAYYAGTPQYRERLEAFRAKYGAEGKDAKELTYTAAEVERGLEGQPVDYQRTSSKLQTQLLSGPHAYDPVTVMQQQGVARFQGYAFPPTVELGKLKGPDHELKDLHKAHQRHPLVAKVWRGINTLVGRRDARDDYVVMRDRPHADSHLLYRTMGLDAVQRRQMRYMLTDFDHADRHTTFHVMMSYPYTDWIHVLYMVLVGWCLYQLQVRYGAYEFYDEYMGLDLRQAPRLQRPVLACMTVVVMVFILFQPLLVASIATTRAYRIFMRRPIGPP